jgi:hypothetical protein
MFSLLPIKSDQQLNFVDSTKVSYNFHVKGKINPTFTKTVRVALIQYHFKYYQHHSCLKLFTLPPKNKIGI